MKVMCTLPKKHHVNVGAGLACFFVNFIFKNIFQTLHVVQLQFASGIIRM